MSWSNEDRRAVRSDGWWIFRTAWGWVLASLAVITVIGVAWWGLSVALSDPAGKAEAYRRVNNAGNRLAQQAYFEQTYADIKAADRKLTTLATAAKGQPADSAAATRLTGAENYCQDLVGDYNAAARKQVAERFRDVDLPPQIDTSDPATDCEPPK